MISIHKNTAFFVEGTTGLVGHGHIAGIFLLVDKLTSLYRLSKCRVIFTHCHRIAFTLVLLLAETNTSLKIRQLTGVIFKDVIFQHK